MFYRRTFGVYVSYTLPDKESHHLDFTKETGESLPLYWRFVDPVCSRMRSVDHPTITE